MQNNKRLTDEQLVAAYADGNNQAFDTLLERNQKRVFSYIFNIVKNRELADDIFQETFVKAITTIKQRRYTESGKFSAWLTRIAHNLIIDHYRLEKTNGVVSTDEADSTLLNRREFAEDTIEDFLIDEQISSDVRKIMETLPQLQREVIEMRFYRNMSFKEIADATNVSINTALGRMRYAILNMRKIAKDHNIVLTR
ncbi:MAG: sigma-70 family RNA polymerase sigma factor [Muribaculaceae bacterium]|nr:sigma-70 family RNA polymerase sigma factor [Muribaculaceae bacterium]